MKTQNKVKRITWFCISAVICCASLGCGMTNEEIIKEVNYCNENNMQPVILMTIFGTVRKITCLPEQKN